MKITIGTKSAPNAIVREIPTPPTLPDPRPFAVRNAEVGEKIALNRRRQMRVVDGGRD
jgi:hypothetical protein